MKLLALLTLSSVTLSQPMYKASLVSVGACAAADVASSQNLYEVNPLMRKNPWLIKGVVTGSWLGIQWIFKHRIPKKPAQVGNWLMSGTWCGAAAWNFSR